MKIVGVVKFIVGTDAVIAIDEDGNQRAIFPGDTLYDNEKLLELSGVQVNIEPVTVADAQKKSEPKSDKEVASLQDALLNGKDISELEETAAGGNAGGGNASSDGVSLGAASFVASGHESSIHADANAISEVAPASVAGVTNVSGGAEEFVSSLETLTVANELLTPQPSRPVVSETPVAITPATPGATINVYNEAGAIIATHTVDDTSIYDITLPTLADGAYKFKMEAISPTTGNVIDTIETKPFTVDTNAPTIEWTKLPDDISGGGRINKPNGEEIEFAGKTEPFSDVKFIVYDNALGNSVVMQVRADEHGEFSQKIPDAFPGGIYDVSVQVTDPAGNWVAPIKLPETEVSIVQPVAPAPSEPAHISDNIFEITRMYTDEDSDLRTSYTPSYPNTTAGFDFKPTFEGKATAFADIALSIAKQGNYNWALGKNNPDIPVDVLTTKADADGNWKVESGKDYAQGSHRISADVTNTDGNTYHSTSEAFYMPTDPFIVEPVDHL